MRICYLCPDTGVRLAKHNGSAAHVRSLVGAFGELGHEVDLLMPRVEGADELGVRVRRIPSAEFAGALNALARNSGSFNDDREKTIGVLRALRRIWSNSSVEQTLVDELTRNRPDIVYERYSPYCVAGAVVARRLGRIHVLEVNAPLAWEGARHRQQALNEAADVLELLTFEATSQIVAVSDELRDQLVHAGVSPAKISVVPNGVAPSLFDPDGPVLPVGLEDKIVLGFVGSLKPWHGVDVLVEAFTELAVDPRLHLLVVGDGPLAGAVEGVRDRLPGRVTFTGSVPHSDVPAYLRATDIAVAPYPRSERFYFSPLKVLEYMASATAVVASRIGQLEQLVRDEQTGLLVEPGDARGLVHAVRRLADDEPLRRKLGARAAEECVASHGWTQRAEQILELARAVA